MDTVENANVIFMPGSQSAPSSSSMMSERVANSAQERRAAARMAQMGEGEEMIVGQVEDGGIGASLTKKSVLETPSRNNTSMWQNEDEEDDTAMVDVPASAFQYDSDSSQEDKKSKSKQQRRNQKQASTQQHLLPPQQLPFFTKDQTKKTNADANTNHYEAPFLPDWNTFDDPILKKKEQNSWIMFNFPTRLPRLDPRSTITGMSIIKQEGNNNGDSNDDENNNNEDDDAMLLDLEDHPDHPSNITTTTTTAATNTTSTTNTGYDDTLKDAAPGKYGKIVVHKSGKAYFIIGNGTNQVRMQLMEGLKCGFTQQAVAMDPDQGTYIPLGNVKKNMLVIPDVENAFSSF